MNIVLALSIHAKLIIVGVGDHNFDKEAVVCVTIYVPLKAGAICRDLF